MPVPFVTNIRPRNFLSFGPEFPGIDLGPLTLLIGANASGKSNLIEAISFMRAAPKDFRDVVRQGGGVGEWIWKGDPEGIADLSWIIGRDHLRSGASASAQRLSIKHEACFCGKGNAFRLVDERIEEVERRRKDSEDVFYFYRFGKGKRTVSTGGNGRRTISPDGADENASILAELKDRDTYPELTQLSDKYSRIRIYREWTFGRNAVFREPQRADSRNHILEEDFSNLGMFLNRLKTRFPAVKRVLVERLRDLYEGLTDFGVDVEGGTVQVFFAEGDYSIPATRLSDGTLRYLCLLAILCDPEPPPLVCIEEPELGLHPDIIHKIADLMVEASTRTQLIVTTHSEILVDCMTERPECVVVCEKHNGQTEMKQLSKDELQVWLKDYSLGKLWRDGQLGGTRW